MIIQKNVSIPETMTYQQRYHERNEENTQKKVEGIMKRTRRVLRTDLLSIQGIFWGKKFKRQYDENRNPIFFRVKSKRTSIGKNKD